MADNSVKKLYKALDEYYNKFGVDYKTEMFSRPPINEIIEDINNCIQNNKAQPVWDKDKNKDIII